mgnify:CR=1 FL=1|tara:strand:- start:1419 stop:2279 length:861 start_codon:yes stop_codon:yes gene_type:complete
MPGDNQQGRERRNSVFQDASNQGIPTRDVMQEDFGITIPVDSVPLPSAGVVYPADGTLFGCETIDIKAMTAREEDILTSRALIKKGTVVTELLRSCIVDKSIDPEQLLSGDRNALMTAVRITGYGSDYTVEVECPECDEKSKETFQLADLEIKRLEINPVAEGSNQFEFKLPLTKKDTRFKFLTGHDEREMNTISERRKKQGLSGDSLITQRLMHQIVSISGITDKNKINQFIRSMPAGDSLALRRYIDKHEPGINMKSWMECKHCSEQSEVRLPMGASFFWPDFE